MFLAKMLSGVRVASISPAVLLFMMLPRRKAVPEK